MNAPLVSYQRHRSQIDAAIERVLKSGRYVLGSEVEAFEHEFAEYLGAGHSGVGVANGTDAITIALLALGVIPGDEVIVPSHTAVATVIGVERAGAVPVFADILPGCYTIDPASVDSVVTPRTVALIAVHLYGQSARLEELDAVCDKHEIALIEDCAQAHGAERYRRRVGTFGEASAFSFYPTKNLGCLGDGGFLCLKDQRAVTKARELRQYGWPKDTRNQCRTKGMNSRLDEIQAAVLREKLLFLDKENEERRILAEEYSACYVPNPPMIDSGNLHVWHQYVTEVEPERRDAIIRTLRAKGIAADVHYPVPVHKQRPWQRARHCELPITEYVAESVISIPVFPGCDVDAEVLREVLSC
jgi:dTDP-3-amino-3,4,6-trideoxy-alpha-D-glucose transaminase